AHVVERQVELLARGRAGQPHRAGLSRALAGPGAFAVGGGPLHGQPLALAGDGVGGAAVLQRGIFALFDAQPIDAPLAGQLGARPSAGWPSDTTWPSTTSGSFGLSASSSGAEGGSWGDCAALDPCVAREPGAVCSRWSCAREFDTSETRLGLGRASPPWKMGL